MNKKMQKYVQQCKDNNVEAKVKVDMGECS